MDKNKQQQKSFANIISREKFENLNEDDLLKFEVENEILILSHIPKYLNIVFFNSIESENKAMKKQIFENELTKYSNDISWDYFIHINPILIEEIFHYLLKLMKDNNNINNSFNDIKLELATAINDENKKIILKNNLYNYTNELNNNFLFKQFFSFFNKTEIDSEEFTSLIKTIISTDKNLY